MVGTARATARTPLGLLEWLVQNRNITEEAVRKAGGSEKTRRMRRALARGERDVVQKALTRLRGGDRGKQWFVLEGPSYPDAYLETDSIVLVVEGKRTEASTTTTTTFMKNRHQLIRHMDAAREVADGRRVLGLLLVEGEDPDPKLVPERWSLASDEQVSFNSLNDSLPHRTSAERHSFSEGVLGAATWQRVCEEFGIGWPPADDRA